MCIVLGLCVPWLTDEVCVACFAVWRTRNRTPTSNTHTAFFDDLSEGHTSTFDHPDSIACMRLSSSMPILNKRKFPANGPWLATHSARQPIFGARSKASHRDLWVCVDLAYYSAAFPLSGWCWVEKWIGGNSRKAEYWIRRRLRILHIWIANSVLYKVFSDCFEGLKPCVVNWGGNFHLKYTIYLQRESWYYALVLIICETNIWLVGLISLFDQIFVLETISHS